MLLERDGKIDIDASVGSYLPAVPHAKEVTIRQLLTHTSGLPNYTDHPGFFDAITTTYAPAQLLALVKDQPLRFPPGTKWEYSNTNYLVLGMLIEKVSGAPYASFVQHRLFEPLGLRATSYPAAMPSGPQFAVGYAFEDGNVQAVPATSMSWAYAAGALLSNVDDPVKWDDAFLNGRVVDNAAVTEMTTPAKLVDGSSTSYGFGWIISKLYGHREVWHNGGLPGFSTRNATFPDDHLEIIVLGNTMMFDPTEVVRKVFAVLEPQAAASAPLLPRAPDEDPAITKRAEEWFVRLQKGDIDQAQLTNDMVAGLTSDTVKQLAASLGPLGAPKAFVFIGKTMKGTYSVYQYHAECANGALTFTFVLDQAAKVAGLFVKPDAP